jgi:hypothetical protein
VWPSTIEGESGWVEHKQHDLIMKMTTDHFVESWAEALQDRAAAGESGNSNHQLVELQRLGNILVLNMDLLYHRKIDASVLEAVADDMHHLEEDNLFGFLPPQLATVTVGRRTHSMVTMADSILHVPAIHSSQQVVGDMP